MDRKWFITYFNNILDNISVSKPKNMHTSIAICEIYKLEFGRDRIMKKKRIEGKQIENARKLQKPS